MWLWFISWTPVRSFGQEKSFKQSKWNVSGHILESATITIKTIENLTVLEIWLYWYFNRQFVYSSDKHCFKMDFRTASVNNCRVHNHSELFRLTLLIWRWSMYLLQNVVHYYFHFWISSTDGWGTSCGAVTVADSYPVLTFSSEYSTGCFSFVLITYSYFSNYCGCWTTMYGIQELATVHHQNIF